jgi:hypothetical protein
MAGICPICEGEICHVEVTDVAGTRAFSLCCGAPTEIIDNWDVFEALPKNLQTAAIERVKAEYAAMDEVSAENTRRCKENEDRWNKSHGWLFKGQQQRVGELV